MITVPVIVDSVKRDKGFAMVRCNYFAVASDSPTASGFESAGGRRLPVLTLGGSGILYRPLGRARTFRDPDQIKRVFEAVEGVDDVYVDVDDTWLPISAFPDSPRKSLMRGGVFRVSLELFKLAGDYRRGRIPEKEYLERAPRIENGITYSRQETKAFGRWVDTTIEEARTLYNSRSAMKLPRRTKAS